MNYKPGAEPFSIVLYYVYKDILWLLIFKNKMGFINRHLVENFHGTID